MEKKEKKVIGSKILFSCILVSTVIIAAISKIMCFGLYTLIGLVIIVPYFIIFIVANSITIDCIDKSWIPKILLIISCITFLLTFILLPSQHGVNGLGYSKEKIDIYYVSVFGQVKDDFGPEEFYRIAHIALFINIATVISGFFMPALKLKKANNSENNTDKDINIKED